MLRKFLFTLFLLVATFCSAQKAQLVFNEVFTSRNFNTNPLTIPDLNGDSYDYELVIFGYGVSDADVDFQIRFNNDSSTNYRRYYMSGVGSSVGGQVNEVRDALILVDMRRTAYPTLARITIGGSSGSERYVSWLTGGTTNSNSIVRKSSGYWKNTVDPIESINLTSDISGNSDAHIMLYRYPKDPSQGNWEKVDKLTWTAESAEKSFTNLDGDRDKKYKVVWSGDADLNTEINNDSGTNYTRQFLRNNNGSIDTANSTTRTNFEMERQGVAIIIAETGRNRLIASSNSRNIASQQLEHAFWYRNTATNITTLDCTPSVAASGTATLFRQKRNNPDVLPWELVESVYINGDFSGGHIFDSLRGDSEKLYRLEWIGHNTSGTTILKLQYNADTGNNYTEQTLRSSLSSVAASSTTNDHIEFVKTSSAKVGSGALVLYPNSGSNRPSINSKYFSEDALQFYADWWDNSIDEISSIKIFANNTNTITGTLKLWRLK